MDFRLILKDGFTTLNCIFTLNNDYLQINSLSPYNQYQYSLSEIFLTTNKSSLLLSVWYLNTDFIINDYQNDHSEYSPKQQFQLCFHFFQRLYFWNLNSKILFNSQRFIFAKMYQLEEYQGRSFYVKIINKIKDNIEWAPMIEAIKYKFIQYDTLLTEISKTGDHNNTPMKLQQNENIDDIEKIVNSDFLNYRIGGGCVDRKENPEFEVKIIDSLFRGFLKIWSEIRKSIAKQFFDSKYKIDLNVPDVIKNYTSHRMKSIKYQEWVADNLKLKNDLILKSFENNAKCNDWLQYLKSIEHKSWSTCFKCGNILHATKYETSPTCNYDEKCRWNERSKLYCVKCWIYFCDYCVNNNNWINWRYSTCQCCSVTFQWMKMQIKPCNSCSQKNEMRECFIFCFFKKRFYCWNCLEWRLPKCGGNHDWVEILNSVNVWKGESCLNLKNEFNSHVNGVMSQGVITCSKCRTMLNSKYYVCDRCNLRLCNNCWNTIKMLI